MAQCVFGSIVKVAGGNVGVELVVLEDMNVKLGKKVNMCVEEVVVGKVKVKLGLKVKLGKNVKDGVIWGET